MRRELDRPFDAPVWPDGLTVGHFGADDAPAVHALLQRAYARGGGDVMPYDVWLPRMTGDAEYDPRLWFVVRDVKGIAGVALCWTSAFVKDIAVDLRWRRRGLGEALLLLVFGEFAARSAPAVELKVDSDNPSGAVRLYRRMGFEIVERSALS